METKIQRKEARKPTFGEAVVPIIFMVLVLGIGKGMLHWPTEICLLLSAVFAGIVAMIRLSFTWEQLEGFIVDKIAAVMPPVLIVIFVGFMIATWSYSGTLPMLVFYGMKWIRPDLFLGIAYISTAVLAYVSGASWGAVASIGVALMGIGSGLGVPPAMTAAAVVTGAYFGDKTSPLSDSTNLAAAVTKIPLYDSIKYMLWTTTPSMVIAIIVNFILGYSLHITGQVSPESLKLLDQLQSLFHFGFLPLLPMLFILIGTTMRLPTIPVMLLSATVAVFVGHFYQGHEFAYGLKAAMNGFDLATTGVDTSKVLPSVLDLVNRGGLSNNGGFLAFIFCGMAFAGVLTGTGMMGVVMDKFTQGVKTVFAAVILTEIQCIVINLLTGSDGLNKIITTEVMMRKFLQLRIHPIVLCRTLEDSGTMTGPIVPWSAAGIYMTATLGVATTAYMPYCVMFYISIFMAAFYAFTGLTIKRITDEEAYAMAAERGLSLD